MPQKNIHLIWMFLVFPWIQIVFSIKVSTEWIIREIWTACVHFLAYKIVKNNCGLEINCPLHEEKSKK